MSLYLKYRPDTLETIKGNSDVVNILEKKLAKPKTCPHSFLLHGPTGTGKTTVARIIASRLGCVGNDLMELNISNVRGIDNVREIIDNSRFQAMEGEVRVWIMDEFQKATSDAQNAILKILEDTPKHVFFILCTTEPNKLIAPIRGRCLDLQMKPLSDSQMRGLLRKVVRGEEASIAEEVYEVIIRDSLGLPRNAIQILEKVIEAEPERQVEIAQQSAIELSQSIELCRALIDNAKWTKIASILRGLKEAAVEPEDIRRHVLGYCQAILLKGENDMAAHVMEEFLENTYVNGFNQIVYASYSIIKT
jgi:DNA polymerase III gamma/tau subunit